MELKITKETTLRDLTKQFTRQFPNLKLEFWRQPQKGNERSLLVRRPGDSVSLGILRRLKKEGVFTYDKTTTVADFEERLQNEFGLPVQVFRKDDGLWIETAQTGDWSLGKQNAMGTATNYGYHFNSNSLFL